MRREGRPVILFVAGPTGMGGSNRSLAELLEALDSKVTRVLAAPRNGAFIDHVKAFGLADELLPLRLGRRWYKLRLAGAAMRIVLWTWQERERLTAIHANAITGLTLAAVAAGISKVPLVVWVHDPNTNRKRRSFLPILRRLVKDVRWAAVSPVARQVVVDYGLCAADRIRVVPNPIDPGRILATQRDRSNGTTIGFLGGTTHRKGFDLLPDVIRSTSGLPVVWKLFADRSPSRFADRVWRKIDNLNGVPVQALGRDNDVRSVYAQCDIVFVASRSESFCRVAAEAMLNGIPVVGSDIEPLRDLLGSDEAGLLYPVGNAPAAAAAVRRLVKDSDLRLKLGNEGRKRAEAYAPGPVAETMLQLYCEEP